MVLVLLVSGCTSDLSAVPVISRATVHVDRGRPAEPPVVDVSLTLIGGDEEHMAILDNVYIGRSPFQQERDLELYFPTPTIHMDPRSQAEVTLVGEVPRDLVIDHCQSTLPIGATMSFEDTADLIAFSPIGQLVVFCN
jgi:hypothetical protein